jgi:magnesium-transporting ATPase (P-type)
LFLVNVLSLLLTGMGILLLVNLLTADAFRLFKERGGQLESQVFAFGVVILMIAPFLIGLLFALVASIRYNSFFAEEIWLTVNRVPIWLYVATTLPCSLTLVASWKAKALCYQRLWDSGAKTEGGRQMTDDSPR